MKKATTNIMQMLRKTTIATMLGLVAIAVFIPVVFGIVFHNFILWDYTKTGPLGDTVGGLTAPVVNLIAAWLIWRSFWAQIKANKLQKKQWRHDKVINSIQMHIYQLREDISSLSLEDDSKKERILYLGSPSIRKFTLILYKSEFKVTNVSEVMTGYYVFLSRLCAVLQAFTSVVDLIQSVKGLSSKEREIYLSMTRSLYALHMAVDMQLIIERVIEVIDIQGAIEAKVVPNIQKEPALNLCRNLREWHEKITGNAASATGTLHSDSLPT